MPGKGNKALDWSTLYGATNGAAESLVQTFKHAMVKSSLTPQRALQEFLMQFHWTPLLSGYSTSELLNGWQIRSKIDTILPSKTYTHRPGKTGQRGHEVAVTRGQQCTFSKQADIENVRAGRPVFGMLYI